MLPEFILPDPGSTDLEGRENLSAHRRATATSSYTVKTLVWVFPEKPQTTCPATLPQPRISVPYSNPGVISRSSSILSSSSDLIPTTSGPSPSSSGVFPSKPGVRGSNPRVLSSKSTIPSSDSSFLSINSEALQWITIVAYATLLVVILPAIIMRRKWKRRQVVVQHRKEMQRRRARTRIEQGEKLVHELEGENSEDKP